MNMTFDWIKLRGSHDKHVGYNTSWKTSLPLAGKTRNMGWQILLQKVNYFIIYILRNTHQKAMS